MSHRRSASLPSLLALVALLSVPAGAAGQSFGAAVLVDGDVVGFAEPASRLRPGVVRLFAAGPGGEWALSATLQAAEGTAGDGFGTSVARDGDRLLVGAPGADGGRGAAYVFERRDGRWVETARLTMPDDAPDAGPDAGLGHAVALEGGVALVARDDGKVLSMAGMVESMIGPAQRERSPGAVHVFRHGVSGDWAHGGRLSAEGAGPGIGFGEALALHDGVAYAGAGRAAGGRGAVYVFEAEHGDWRQRREVAGPAAGSGFGAAVAVDAEGRLIVGAPTANGQLGAVLVMRRRAEGVAGAAAADDAEGAADDAEGAADPEGAWIEEARLTGQGDAHVGASVAVRDGEVWAGALRTAFSWTYDVAGNAWSGATQHAVERDPQTEFFGTEVALGETFAVVGFPDDDFGAGTGAIFARDAGAWTAAGTVAGEVDALAAVTGGEVRCEAGEADAFACGQVDLLAFLPREQLGAGRGVQVNDLWGWTDAGTGREYVILGRGDGTAFVDVTDPANPVFVGNLPRTPGAPESLWRDVKTIGHYALVVSDNAGPHGMQVFDLTRLRDVADPPAELAPDTVYTGIHSAHNLIVNEPIGMAYAVGGSGGGQACGGGMHAIDVRDPLAPTFAGCVTYSEANNPMAGLTHDSHCVTYAGPDAEHAGKQICMNSNLGGVTIVDVTDPSTPVTLAVGKYPGSALPHQGWLTEDHRYFLHGDEGDELQGLTERTRTLVWDVTDLDDPVIGGEYLHPTREIDHNMYVRGDLVYQANYGAGLRILDVSNPTQPVEVGFFDTVPYGEEEPSFDLGAWSVYPYFESGTIAVSSGAEGLFLLRYEPAEPPTS